MNSCRCSAPPSDRRYFLRHHREAGADERRNRVAGGVGVGGHQAEIPDLGGMLGDRQLEGAVLELGDDRFGASKPASLILPALPAAFTPLAVPEAENRLAPKTPARSGTRPSTAWTCAAALLASSSLNCVSRTSMSVKSSSPP